VRLQAEADARGVSGSHVSMGGLALAWVMAHPLVTAPIVGPRKPDHLQPVREALQLKLSPSERDDLGRLFATE
jgi:aryl-alcohol dehydrogenase-like predicted oxidoreductase